MSYKLEKPYTNIQRADFIVTHQGMKPIFIYDQEDNETIVYFLEDYEELKNGEVIDISATTEYIEKKFLEKESEFKENFIELSCGCLRKKPKGYTSITEAMNSAFNVVSVMHKLPEGILTFYPKPDFSQVKVIEEYLEANLFKNQELSEDEFKSLYVEFQTIWNQQEHL